MRFIPQSIPEVVLIEPQVHGDSRGYFMESFHQERLEAFVGRSFHFVQDNESRSSYGVLRGLHFQAPPHAQTKLVRVVEGAVLDVAVDIRGGSPTFGRHVAMELSAENKRQLLVPRGFAHGFVVLSSAATFLYKVDSHYAPECDGGVAHDDPALGIDWRVPAGDRRLSDKDRSLPKLADLPHVFHYEKSNNA